VQPAEFTARFCSLRDIEISFLTGRVFELAKLYSIGHRICYTMRVARGHHAVNSKQIIQLHS